MDPVATVPLALFDFLPVLLAGLACFVLARGVIARDAPVVRTAALVGAGLVLVAGLCKVLWKLCLAADIGNLHPLENVLFLLLCPGFVLIAWALRRERGATDSILLPVGIVAVSYAAAVTLRSTGPLLLVAVLGATATGVLALLLAARGADRAAMALFGAQLVLAFALVPLASPPHTIGKQWLEESLNTVGQAALLLGALRLAALRVPVPAGLIRQPQRSTT